ncbi:MAG: 30S ribosomal protein S8 [bacterium]|nr:30S ribosomal protein S8 [bacterium]
MLIRIKNAQAARKERLLIPFSKMKWEIAKVLKEAGFIQDFERRKKKIKKTEHAFIEVKLEVTAGDVAISEVKIISKPSRRVYIKKSEIRPVLGGYGIAILSTPKGVMTGEEAKKNNLGGEWLAEIW